MKIKFTYSLSAISLLIILIMGITGFKNPESIKSIKEVSSGELNFTVRTVSAGGNYSPKHVFVIWIEDNDGFVKTRKLRGNARKQYLYTWKASTTAAGSPYNVVDAITGSTLTSHTTHTVTWDCLDLDGNIVPDGDYTVWVEFTDKHDQGPLYSLSFTKGPDAINITPEDETYFKDIELVFSPIVSEFNADVTVVCEEGSTTFTSESVNANEWNWNFGEGAFPATANTEGPHTVSYSSTGFKTVSLTINGSLTETKENYIEVVSSPVAEFDFSGSDYTINFLNSSSSADSYLWDFGDGNTSTEENPTHTYAVGGSYMVNLSAMNADCSDDTSQEVIVPVVGINENSTTDVFTIFPNPSNGSFAMDLNGFNNIKEIQIIDFSGKKVAFDKSYLNNSIKFQLYEKNCGIYFIQITTVNQVYSNKFIVK